MPAYLVPRTVLDQVSQALTVYPKDGIRKDRVCQSSRNSPISYEIGTSVAFPIAREVSDPPSPSPSSSLSPSQSFYHIHQALKYSIPSNPTKSERSEVDFKFARKVPPFGAIGYMGGHVLF